MANGLKSTVIIGQKGLTESLMKSIDSALVDHELIKIKFNDHKEKKDGISDEIISVTGACKVNMVGNVLILYRESTLQEKRKIKLPV
jgi:RNA-binding protein